MNTHDIELPPLPSPLGIVNPDGTEGMLQYTAKDLQDYAKEYARAAIEADRKRHDRMLAHEWIRPALDLPENAPYRFDYYAQEIERLRNDRKRRGEPVAWVAADTLNSPHPGCVSSLAYMSQLDKDRGREYVPLYAAPVAAQRAKEE